MKSLLSIFFALISISTSFSKTAVGVLSRTEGGSERCFVYDGKMHRFSPAFAVNFSITIANTNIDNSCDFPWTIKAFVGDEEVGSSDIILEESFLIDRDLLTTSKTVYIPEANLDPYIQECFTNTCHKVFSTINITFKIYSGEFQVVEDCPKFIDPSLLPNSHIYTKNLNFASCKKTTVSGGLGNLDLSQSDINTTTYPTNEVVKANKLLQELRSNEIMIFPNPIERGQYINLVIQGDKNKHSKFDIISAEGKLIFTNHISRYKEKIRINTSNLIAGIYTVKIYLKDKIINKRILIMN